MNEKDKRINISIEELIKLKNKLHNINENEKNSSTSENFESDKNQQKKDVNAEMKIKLKNLLFFKKLITNIELIVNEYINTLRNKGISLPIKIFIKVKKDDIKRYLGDEITYFEKKIHKKKMVLKIF